jgi:hypothetical protein
MADVHRFRDVRRAEVDDDLLRLIDARNAEAFVVEDRGGLLRENFRAEREVNESGASDRRRLGNVGDV